MSPRKRKTENKWMEAYPGLYCRDDGVFQIKHPVTGVKTGLGTKDPKTAIKAWQAYMPKWIAERDAVAADALLAKLDHREKIDDLGRSYTLASYAKYWRDEWLRFSVDKQNHAVFGDCRVKAKGKNGTPISRRTQEDYGRLIIREIENASGVNFPLNDKYADVRIRQFLSPWADKNRTYNYLRSVLSILYSHAVLEGIVRRNPVLDIKPLEKTKRLVYVTDKVYADVTKKMMVHTHYGVEQDGEWRARICDLALFSGCRPDDVTKIEDGWFDEHGKLRYRASKNQKLVELEDETGALAETVQWLRAFKRAQGKISKYLCVYPRYMGLKMWRQDRVSAVHISRQWSAGVIDAGYPKGAYQFKDIRKKSLADDPGVNKGAHGKVMQAYYEQVVERAVQTRNRLTQPRDKG